MPPEVPTVVEWDRGRGKKPGRGIVWAWHTYRRRIGAIVLTTESRFVWVPMKRIRPESVRVGSRGRKK